ncbi:transport and Golgi organization protein 11 isoform X2 [Eurytemora carolleeae]|uniref:transport and Golgi organization protein 11 isoform X2 n=1 Tax=Eurytemora carolleeae TaxID=1294199 RepID=UPI000C770482|nr:transport and Golgi organization protein 11 isoform X2 [Eurytemora carolleeae]|eukprot:XP_023334172.1 transport and Golgi organization protein 11-like isoform X2 [Eurytemora affinis]
MNDYSMSGERYMESDFYSDSAYTADISTRMRVPDRLLAHNGNGVNHAEDEEELRWREKGSMFNMQVPDRILVAGSDQHIHSKSTPRELQLENSVIPPSPDLVRVQTPPRSIKLDDIAYPSAGETQDHFSPPRYTRAPEQRSTRKDRTISFDPDLSLSHGHDSNLSLYDEVQRMRTQMAKLNHRLMATEMENQLQNQRWQVCSVLVSAYFLVKALIWVNRP